MNNKKKKIGLCFNLFLFIVCQAISEINLIYW